MTSKQEDLNSALSPCGSGSHVVYAWALNAPELILPEGVGFRVGGPDSGIDWLVLQVHYASVNRIPEEGILSHFNVCLVLQTLTAIIYCMVRITYVNNPTSH